TEAMNLHLAEISRHVTPGTHAVVTLDRAGWHQTGGRLRVPDNISLLPLPPYSPELNPVENVWQFLRQNQLSNRVFDSYETIVDACCDAWNDLVAAPERITSIASRPWAWFLPSAVSRSEERRVGKECRWRWWGDQVEERGV